ncbi:MAG: antitoxin Xre/MbcA/ParS toxin-binding domain-containing protein [Saprospiraceae bacterium]
MDIVQEALAVYAKQAPKVKDKTLSVPDNDIYSNKILTSYLIHDGMSYEEFERISHMGLLTLQDWADLLSLSYKSLQRYKVSQSRFKPIYTEKILEVSEVLSVGMQVFEDKKKLKLWLQTPSYALDNMRPIKLMTNSYGKDLVLDELVRIEHGIFS